MGRTRDVLHQKSTKNTVLIGCFPVSVDERRREVEVQRLCFEHFRDSGTRSPGFDRAPPHRELDGIDLLVPAIDVERLAVSLERVGDPTVGIQ